MGLYASTAYLRNRDPSAIDLSNERILAFNESYGDIPEIEWISTLELANRVVLRSSSTRALINAATAGAGIALLPDLFASGVRTLVRLTTTFTAPVRTPWLLVHRDLRKVEQLRTVRTWIVNAFQTAQNRQAAQPSENRPSALL